MEIVNEWARQWGVPAPAIQDLMQRMWQTHHAPPPEGTNAASETYVQSAARLEAARCGVMLWRNNVGATETKSGGFLRYGLANDNKEINARIKSADLIGIKRTLITPQHVGHVFGQFVSRECKHANWRPGEDKRREGAQTAWAALVNSWGGDARLIAGPGSFVS